MTDHPALPPIVEAGPAELDGIIGTSPDELVLLYFWGPDCPNCDFFASRLPSLWQALAGKPVRLVKVDAYLHPELARRFGVYGIPHFVLFRGGHRLGKMSEFRGDAFWLAVIGEHLPGSTPTSGRA